MHMKVLNLKDTNHIKTEYSITDIDSVIFIEGNSNFARMSIRPS